MQPIIQGREGRFIHAKVRGEPGVLVSGTVGCIERLIIVGVVDVNFTGTNANDGACLISAQQGLLSLVVGLVHVIPTILLMQIGNLEGVLATTNYIIEKLIKARASRQLGTRDMGQRGPIQLIQRDAG